MSNVRHVFDGCRNKFSTRQREREQAKLRVPQSSEAVTVSPCRVCSAPVRSDDDWECSEGSDRNNHEVWTGVYVTREVLETRRRTHWQEQQTEEALARPENYFYARRRQWMRTRRGVNQKEGN